MKRYRSIITLFLCSLFCVPSAFSKTGALIMAHGKGEEWNNMVREAAKPLKEHYEVAIAFGMAKPSSLQKGIEQLEEKGVDRIVAVPLFISSYSPIITQSSYLFGLREKPPETYMVMKPYMMNRKLFGMLDPYKELSHYLIGQRPGPVKAKCMVKETVPDEKKAQGILKAYRKFHKDYQNAVSRIQPLEIDVPIVMTEPLNDHDVVAKILDKRMAGLAEDPENERVVIVGHGPNAEKNNVKWVKTMESLAGKIRNLRKENGEKPFGAIHCLTVRDDAPAPIHDQAKNQLRATVRQASAYGKVIVAPLLLSEGGVEDKIAKRLKGLDHEWSGKTLLPDPLITDFLKASMESGEKDF